MKDNLIWRLMNNTLVLIDKNERDFVVYAKVYNSYSDAPVRKRCPCYSIGNSRNGITVPSIEEGMRIARELVESCAINQNSAT